MALSCLNAVAGMELQVIGMTIYLFPRSIVLQIGERGDRSKHMHVVKCLVAHLKDSEKRTVAVREYFGL